MRQRSLFDKNTGEETSVGAQAEALSLRESLLTASGLAIIVTNPQGTITTFNTAAERLLGYTAGEVVGKTTPLLFHDTEEISRRAEEAEKETGKKIEPASSVLISKLYHEKSSDWEIWNFVRKDGSQFTGSLSVVSLQDEHGTVTGYAGIISDLTELQKLKKQIALSEQKFTLLAENVPGAIYLCENDEHYSVIYLNDQIEAITGYPAKDFVAKKFPFGSLIHPEDRDRVVGEIKTPARKKSVQTTYRLRHASGEWRWISETRVGVYEGERLTLLEGFLQDITFQREAEEKLHKVAEENLRFFNNPVNINAVVAFDGFLQRISPSWTKMLGWSEEELKARPVMSFIHPQDIESTQDALKSITKSRKVHTFENRFCCKDGSYRWLMWGSASDPETRLIYSSAIDISARKRSEEDILDSKENLEGLTRQLQDQNRRLDEFAHIISHNLRAPVNNIQALINLLDEKSEISDYRLIFEKLKNVSKNLSETMNELMDTLKAKTQLEVDLSEIRFKEVLDKVVQSLEGELIVAEAAVTFDFNEAPTIWYSKPYLESIFQNLLTNSIKYRSPHRKPSIHFKSQVVGNHLELHVTDNGQGIDMARFGDKVFGLHKTFHDHREARGVGLFLIKTQIEAMGGSIVVNSEVDKGTTFTILFN